MEKLKNFCVRFRYELTALLAFLPLYAINFETTTFQNTFIIAFQLILAALFAGRYVKSFEEGSRKNAGFVAACFAICVMALYHYSLFSLSTVDYKHLFVYLLLLASYICLTDERIAALAVPISIAGVIISKDYAVLCLPSLTVAAAFAGDGIFDAKKENKPQIKKSKSKKKVRADANAGFNALIQFNRFIAPAFIALAVITAIVYAIKGNDLGKLIFADRGYLLMNYKYLSMLAPAVAVFAVLWCGALKNRRSLAAFILSLVACAVTIIGAYLFDFYLLLFRYYVLSAVTGLFATEMIISMRSGEQDDSMKKAVTQLGTKTACAAIFITLVFLPLAHAYISK